MKRVLIGLIWLVTLKFAWDCDDPRVTGYKLYGSTNLVTWQVMVTTSNRFASVTFDGPIYFFCVTATNAAGVESDGPKNVTHPP
jgi:hypothetical protein